jgi:hypothetical protein
VITFGAANLAPSRAVASPTLSERMASMADGFPGVACPHAIAAQHVYAVRDCLKMERMHATRLRAEVIQLLARRDRPMDRRPRELMDLPLLAADGHIAVAEHASRSAPVPAVTGGAGLDSAENRVPVTVLDACRARKMLGQHGGLGR